MRLSGFRAVAALGGLLACAAPLHAQGYHIRWDTWLQSAAFRGVSLDSVLASETEIGEGGGSYYDGIAVKCGTGADFCTYFDLGEERRGAPLTSTIDASIWGFGIQGLKLHVKGRYNTDLEDGNVWPGTRPQGQLLEAYAEYSNPLLTVQAGRTHVYSRLGFWGFDGAQATIRPIGGRLKLSAYGGWALAEAALLPVNSEDLNPLDDYQPAEREVIVGGTAGVSLSGFDLRVIYQRLIDTEVDRPTSDRGAVEAAVRPGAGFTVTGGMEYNFGQGDIGTSNVQVAYQDPGNWVRLVVGNRWYRPTFPLWSIWGVFSPAGYSTRYGSIGLYVIPGLELRTRGEAYSYNQGGSLVDNSGDTENPPSPLSVATEDSGWRWSAGATYAGLRWLVLDATYAAQYGPGASSQGFNGRMTFEPLRQVALTAHGGYLERPLEYRFWDAEVYSYGARLELQPIPGIFANVGAIRYDETRERPDALRSEWDHWRFSAGLTFVLSSSGSRSRGLHPSILRIPEMRGSR
jgi:hypothetical protein